MYLPPPGVALFPVVSGACTGSGGQARVLSSRTKSMILGRVSAFVSVRKVSVRRLCPAALTTANHISPISPGPCGSCRRGATFNPQTCSCECPCPQGFLLPGPGCVPQCPAGYSQAYDSSNSPPVWVFVLRSNGNCNRSGSAAS